MVVALEVEVSRFPADFFLMALSPGAYLLDTSSRETI